MGMVSENTQNLLFGISKIISFKLIIECFNKNTIQMTLNKDILPFSMIKYMFRVPSKIGSQYFAIANFEHPVSKSR